MSVPASWMSRRSVRSRSDPPPLPGGKPPEEQPDASEMGLQGDLAEAQ